MGILDITDQFCNPINEMSNNIMKGEIKLGNKVHEQPIVTFIQKENEQDVIYREEV